MGAGSAGLGGRAGGAGISSAGTLSADRGWAAPRSVASGRPAESSGQTGQCPGPAMTQGPAAPRRWLGVCVILSVRRRPAVWPLVTWTQSWWSHSSASWWWRRRRYKGDPDRAARSLLTYTPAQGLTDAAGSRRAHPAPSVCEGRGRPGAGGHPGSPGSLGRLYWASSRATCRKPAILPARGRGRLSATCQSWPLEEEYGRDNRNTESGEGAGSRSVRRRRQEGSGKGARLPPGTPAPRSHSGAGRATWRGGGARTSAKGSWGRERAPEAAASRSYPPFAPHTRAEAQAGVAGAHLDTCFGTINSFSSPIMSL